MMFGGEITFSTPKKIVRSFFFFGAPKTVGLCSLGALKSYFSAPKRKNLVFCFFFRRRLVMVFGGQITLSNPPKHFAAALFFFPTLRKPDVFRRPKPKIGFFGGRLRSKGLGTSNELDVQNEWEENTYIHTHGTFNMPTSYQ